jgi:hypothetical protein
MVKNNNVFLHLGGFQSKQGKAQFIGIDGLIGNDYTLTQSHDMNVMIGLGAYHQVFHPHNVEILIGLDGYYFAKTYVKGNVIQEKLFENLNYRYSITNLPIYAATKFLLNNNVNWNFTLDLGIGPNLLTTQNIHEHSLDGGVTLPDNAFSGSSRVVLSGMAGVGIKFNHFFKKLPLECGYRFFYLGQGQLSKNTSQLNDNLKTGKVYANAILCTI